MLKDPFGFGGGRTISTLAHISPIAKAPARRARPEAPNPPVAGLEFPFIISADEYACDYMKLITIQGPDVTHQHAPIGLLCLRSTERQSESMGRINNHVRNA